MSSNDYKPLLSRRYSHLTSDCRISRSKATTIPFLAALASSRPQSMNAHEGLAAQATRLHAALALCLASRAAHAKGSEYMLRLVASDERRRAPLSLHSLAELLHVSPFRRLRSPPQADSPADTSLAAMRAAPSPPCGRLPRRHAGGSLAAMRAALPLTLANEPRALCASRTR